MRGRLKSLSPFRKACPEHSGRRQRGHAPQGREADSRGCNPRLVRVYLLSPAPQRGAGEDATALFVWMSRFVATAFPLTLPLSRKGRGNPRTASSYKCKPL